MVTGKMHFCSKIEQIKELNFKMDPRYQKRQRGGGSHFIGAEGALKRRVGGAG